MAWSDDDSDNLKRIADRLDPPDYGGGSNGFLESWPRGPRVAAGMFLGAVFGLVPWGIVSIFDSSAAFIIWCCCIAFFGWMAWHQ